jgi:hypothetical protein
MRVDRRCNRELWVVASSVASATRQGADNQYPVALDERLAQLPRLILVDENLDVPTNPILLVNHAKADAGETRVQIGEQFGKRRTASIHFTAFAGIGT